jgi:putative phosphonate metabolism protein
MSAFEPRYAVYFAPPASSPLWRFGCSMLGLDAETGEAAPPPTLRRFDAETWHEITAEPRKYGFHGTLKAPFRLAPGRTEDELDAACARFAEGRARFACAGMAVTAIGRFLALKTVQPCAPLDRLAAGCVSAFDDFRAPLSEVELERRLRAPLSERQRDHLTRWGYPYVFEDFRFHMTLTGALDEDTRTLAEAELREHFALSGADGSLIVSEIALYRQDDGPFRLIARYPFGG